MERLFWKKLEIENNNKQYGRPPKLEEGVQITYMIDQAKYIFTGGVKHPFNNKDLLPTTTTVETSSTGAINFKIGGISKSPFAKPTNSSAANNQDYVYIYNPSDSQWTIHQTTGRIPSRRTHHQVWYDPPYLFIYGGISSEKKTLNDTYLLNVETFQWRRFFYLEGPPPRLHFGFCSVGQQQYLIGGASMPENLLLNDLWQCNFENVAWESQSLELPGVIWSKIEIKDDPSLLPPIKGHSMIAISDSKIFIFGGIGQNKSCIDLSLLLDVENNTMKVFETKGKKPCARAYHQIIQVKQQVLCLYGGIRGNDENPNPQNYLNDLFLLNLQDNFWQIPIVGGYIPQPRFFSAFSGNRNEHYGEVIVLGGKIMDGNVEQCIYVLHELGSGEAWDECNDDEKNKFSSYRDALKNEKKSSLQNIPTLNLEFNEAEKIMIDQKRQMGDKERELKKIQNEIDQYTQQEQEIQAKIEQTKKDVEIKFNQMTTETAQNIKTTEENQLLIEQIKLLLVYERKKRKIIQRKSGCLQESFRKAENFIIGMDQFYCKGIKDDAFAGNVNEEALIRLDKAKQEHRNVLTQFRNDFEGSFKREQHVRKELKQKKNQLKPFENISEFYIQSLRKDEKEFFNKQK